MTGVVNGRNQGFFHGTGPAVGLDMHELPRTGRLDCELRAGQVVTVEPGLYYPGQGAVRIEDMVLVEPGGGLRPFGGLRSGGLTEDNLASIQAFG